MEEMILIEVIIQNMTSKHKSLYRIHLEDNFTKEKFLKLIKIIKIDNNKVATNDNDSRNLNYYNKEQYTSKTPLGDTDAKTVIGRLNKLEINFARGRENFSRQHRYTNLPIKNSYRMQHYNDKDSYNRPYKENNMQRQEYNRDKRMYNNNYNDNIRKN